MFFFLKGVKESAAWRVYSNLPDTPAHPPPVSTPTPRHPQGSGSSLETWGPQNRGAIVWSRVPARQSNAAPRPPSPYKNNSARGAYAHGGERPKHNLWKVVVTEGGEEGMGRGGRGEFRKCLRKMNRQKRRALLTLLLPACHICGLTQTAKQAAPLRKTSKHPTEKFRAAAAERGREHS